VKDEEGNVIYEALESEAKRRSSTATTFRKNLIRHAHVFSNLRGRSEQARRVDRQIAQSSWVQHIAHGNIIVMDEAHNASAKANGKDFARHHPRNQRGNVPLGHIRQASDNMPIYAMRRP